MKRGKKLTFLLILLLFSSTSILITTLSTSVYAQQNQTETKNQIPEVAKGPAIPSKGYLVEEIRDGLFWVTEGAYNTIFLVTDEVL